MFSFCCLFGFFILDETKPPKIFYKPKANTTKLLVRCSEIVGQAVLRWEVTGSNHKPYVYEIGPTGSRSVEGARPKSIYNITNGGNLTINLTIPKILLCRQDSTAVHFCLHSPPDGWKVKVINNGVVFRYRSRSGIYNAVDSRQAAAECIHRKWTGLAEISGWVKCRLRVRAELSYPSCLFHYTTDV